jgi:rhodanese-related sulfurtransferase
MDVPLISARELKALIDAGEPVTIVDVRRDEAWAASPGQVPGALRIAPEHIADALGRVVQGEVIVVYDDTPDESVSAAVAENLMQRNYSGVFALAGGYTTWVQAGFPTEGKRQEVALPSELPVQ